MSGSRKMTLRVQSAEGTARVELSAADATAALYERVYEALRLSSFAFALHRDRQRKDEIVSSKSRSLEQCGLSHGDMLYLTAVNGARLFDTNEEAEQKQSSEPTAGPSSAQHTSVGLSSQKQGIAKEDEVDIILHKQSGKIERQRDEKLCRHNSNGCCVHCSPLEPWDENYLKEHNIKHMSFHAYLRKLMSGKFISLDELSLKIKPGCAEHPPWPRGICSKCQPGAVTLTRQPYRHVDNVVFEHAQLVERFLSYWRATSHQRLGYLYGDYEPHPDVPLGVRARVRAIYEPPQDCSRDHITLLDDPRQPDLDVVCAELGLRRVGWLFTDLLPADRPGRVRRLRGLDTHFLSAQECIMAAHLQNQHPNPCRYASSGHFGSKFVTVCVTGDADEQVHMEGYQVSGQCQALVRDDVLLPTRDAPDLGYIRDSSDAQYVPDLYYKERDAYGNEVSARARRVPVAYVLVDVPAGAARGESTAGASFPPVNGLRPAAAPELVRLVREAPNFLEAVSDLHVLLFLSERLGAERVRALAAAVAAEDAAAAARWRDADGGWTALEAAALWTCPHCTYHNDPSADHCEMCALPR